MTGVVTPIHASPTGSPNTAAGWQHPRTRRLARRRPWLRRLPLLPAFLYIVIVTQAPFAVTFWYSLRSWNLMVPGSDKFIGFNNYRSAFSTPAFRSALITTVEMTSSAVVISMLLGLALALLLHREFVGRGVARTLAITPFLVMPVATALLFKTTVYSPLYGLLDFALGPFGFHHVDWLGTFPLQSIVIVLVWEWTPFMMLIVLAGLQSESMEALEAARVDGANAYQTFVSITYPQLRRYIQLGLLLGSIYVVQAFGEVYTITQGGPGTATTNLPYYLYQQAFRSFNIGEAAATGVIVVILTELIALFALKTFTGMLKASEAVARDG